jgi:hypothetical protein
MWACMSPVRSFYALCARNTDKAECKWSHCQCYSSSFVSLHISWICLGNAMHIEPEQVRKCTHSAIITVAFGRILPLIFVSGRGFPDLGFLTASLPLSEVGVGLHVKCPSLFMGLKQNWRRQLPTKLPSTKFSGNAFSRSHMRTDIRKITVEFLLTINWESA